MLYTDTVSFFLYFFVEDLAKEINACFHLRDAFYFSEISNGHLRTSDVVRLIFTPEKWATSKTRPKGIR